MAKRRGNAADSAGRYVAVAPVNISGERFGAGDTITCGVPEARRLKAQGAIQEKPVAKQAPKSADKQMTGGKSK